MKYSSVSFVCVKIFSLLPLGLATSHLGCSTNTGSPAFKPERNVTGAGQTNLIRDSHEQLTPTLWFQTAAEYQVDSLSKYAMARRHLTNALHDTNWTAALEQTNDVSKLDPAVIMDLDETVLDNSRFQGQLVLDRTNYIEALWNQWVSKADATAVPGALDFIRCAQSLNVRIIFVTNRTRDQEDYTRTNLLKLGIDLADGKDSILTKLESPNWGSDKTSRRSYLAPQYRILMLVGDDLGDFVTGAKSDPAKRVDLAKKYLPYWGERWVLLNNPAYGSWDAALYGHDFSKHDVKVLQEKLGRVQGFK